MSSPTPTEPAPVQPDRDHRRRKAVQYVASLDGLRAIAALGVVIIHTEATAGVAVSTYIITGALVGPFFTLFFAISGFVLYRGWARRNLAVHDPVLPAGARVADGGADGRTGSFLLRRLLRIYPLYWVVATAAIVASDATTTGIVDLIQIYLLLPFPEPDVLLSLGLGIVVWTLIIDVAFYLYVAVHGPVMNRVLRRLPRRWTPFSVETTILVSMALFFPVLSFWVPGPVSALSCLPLGMWFAVIEAQQDRLGHRLPAVLTMVRAWPVWLALYLTIGPLVVNSVLDARDYDVLLTENAGLHVLLVVCAMLLLIVILWGPDRWAVKRALMSSRMRNASLLTYGMYLWHPVVLILLTRFGPEQDLALYLAITITSSIALAGVTYVLVERPLGRLRLDLRRRPRPATSTR